MMKRIIILLFVLFVIAFPAQAQMQWVTGYFGTWLKWDAPATDFDWSNMTHCIIFGENPVATSPYFVPSQYGLLVDGDLSLYINAGHAAGVKMLACIVAGYNPENIDSISMHADQCSLFVTTACYWAKQQHFDGIDIDWEFPREGVAEGWYRFIHLLRANCDSTNWGANHDQKGTLVMSTHYWSGVVSHYYSAYEVSPNSIADMASVFDQINLMSYTMFTTSGYDTPVYAPTVSGYVGDYLDDAVPLWYTSYGLPKSKTGIGISFEGTKQTGVTGLGQTYSTRTFTASSNNSINGAYESVPATTRYWDDVAKANWAYTTNTVYSYQDSNSVKAIVDWAKTNSYGGIMVYNIAIGNDKTVNPHDFLLGIVSREAMGQTMTPDPPEVIPPGLLKVSSVNPRYLVDANDTTKVVWLSGNHFWGNVQDQSNSYPPTAWNFTTDLDTMEANEMNFVRLWSGWEQGRGLVEGTDAWYFKPEIFKRTGAGNANDGQLKFDLDTVNQLYIDRIQLRLDSLSGRGMYASVKLFEGWSIPRTGFTFDTWNYHPFNPDNNVNSLTVSDSNQIHYAPSNGGTSAIWAKWYNYIKKMIDSLNSRDNFVWEVGNEIADYSGNNRHYAFNRLVIDTIRAYESRKAKQHLITYSGDWATDNDSIWASTADIGTPGAGDNGNAFGNGNESTVDPPVNDGSIVRVEDTDHTWGMLDIAAPWYVWECFTRGDGGVVLQDNRCGTYPSWDCNNQYWPQFKRAMGVATKLAYEADLLYMTPSSISSTSAYELAGNASGRSGQVIVWQSSGTVTVDLTGYDSVNVKWIDPDDISAGTYVSAMGTKTAGGASRNFTAPDARYDVLYLYEDAGVPIISVSTITGFGNQTVNTTSGEKTYSLSGSHFTTATGDITVTAPLGFEVSKSTGTGFTTAITYAYTDSTLASSTVYVRFKPTAVQAYTTTVTNAGGGATTQNVAVSGTGTAAPTSGTKYFGRK
jgi:hypothetical protein